VIANELHSRKSKVVLIMSDSHHEIQLTEAQTTSGLEIEQLIVEDLIGQHNVFIQTSCN